MDTIDKSEKRQLDYHVYQLGMEYKTFIRDGDRWEFYGSVRFSVLLLRFGFITVS